MKTLQFRCGGWDLDLEATSPTQVLHGPCRLEGKPCGGTYTNNTVAYPLNCVFRSTD